MLWSVSIVRLRTSFAALSRMDSCGWWAVGFDAVGMTAVCESKHEQAFLKEEVKHVLEVVSNLGFLVSRELLAGWSSCDSIHPRSSVL